MSQPNKNGALVIDSNVLISICSKEVSYPTAKQFLAEYSARNWVFYAPGVIVSEVLFVLCRKLSDGSLTVASYDEGIEMLKDQLAAILPPPRGDAFLVQRAREIQTGYSCLHSADCLYVALAEELAVSGAAELVTFDKRVVNVAVNNAPTVNVTLLPS
ncbi:MAG: type II toxin-antitoxin system VapC family toxin [Acidobacteriota bacterium]|nr:type II toxin-antitoxin system VapC family toxin [Acidobacteriota bacterium]